MTDKLRIDVLTIFPKICDLPLQESMIGKARENGLLELRVHDLRDWTTDKHRQTDDVPYGGGQGMVMKPEPFFAAIEDLKTEDSRVILMTPQGRTLNQRMVEDYAKSSHLIVLCGHYEGVDHRVIEALVDDELSIGDYVLTNGAIAAAVFIDAITRLVPGVLGDKRSADDESFSAEHGLLESPHYTRPPEFRGMKVPEILQSGHHGKIDQWRRDQAIARTKANRPDLFEDAGDEVEDSQ